MQLLTIKEAAAAGNTTEPYICRLLDSGRVAQEEQDGKRKVVAESLQKWLEGKKRKQADKVVPARDGSPVARVGWRKCKGDCGRYYPETPRFWHANRNTGKLQLHTKCRACRNHPVKNYFKSRKRTSSQESEAARIEAANKPESIYVVSGNCDTEQQARKLGESYLAKFRALYAQCYKGETVKSPEYEAAIRSNQAKTQFYYVALVKLPATEFWNLSLRLQGCKLWFVTRASTLAEINAGEVAAHDAQS